MLQRHESAHQAVKAARLVETHFVSPAGDLVITGSYNNYSSRQNREKKCGTCHCQRKQKCLSLCVVLQIKAAEDIPALFFHGGRVAHGGFTAGEEELTDYYSPACHVGVSLIGRTARTKKSLTLLCSSTRPFQPRLSL